MKRFVGMLLILALAGGVALGQEAVEEPITYDDVVAAIGTLNELLEQAIFLATAGMASRSPSDQAVYAQGVLDLLEGTEDPAGAVGVTQQDGLLPMWETIEIAMDDERNHPARDRALSLIDRRDLPTFSTALYYGTGYFLSSAAVAAEEALLDARAGNYENARSAFRSAYAFLISARGGRGEPRSLPGLLVLAELLPPMEIWVRPGESIQAAIDRIPGGGTIRLEPGTYREGLTIAKSLTLAGSRRTIIEIPFGELGAAVESDVPIEVTIRDVEFREGSGLELWGQVRGTIERVTFSGPGNGARVSEGAHADFASCRFSDNSSSVRFLWSSSGSMQDCTVERDSSPYGAIALFCSDVTLRDCVIQDNVGPGVYVGGGEASILHMTGCTLIRSQYGLSAVYGGCNPTTTEEAPETPRYAKSHGTISGWENVIPEPWEDEGNLEGAFEVYFTSFIDLRILVAPRPEEEG